MSSVPDVLVVGAGIAGVAAMIEARTAGASVLGIDAGATIGGTAAKAAAGACIAGTPYQARRGVDDSPALALADLLADNDDADEEWARRYFDQSATELYGWLTGIGVEFDGLYQNEGDSVARWHMPQGGGLEVMRLAQQRLRNLDLDVDATWRLDATVDDLIWHGDRVAGVIAGGDELRARCTVMATGGFAGNHALVQAWCPQLASAERVLAGGGRGARGSGHELLARHGAELVNLEHICAYAAGVPDPTDATGARGVVARTAGTWVWVNADGCRFYADESSVVGFGSAIDALLEQPGQHCWAIVDEAGAGKVQVNDHLVEPPESLEQAAARIFATSPHVRRGADVDELARETGVDAAALAESCSGLTGSLTAIELFPMARKTLGGVRTDERCNVFAGLYAAGELTGFGGGHMTGSRPLEGMMFGGSLFSGRIAGREAAREAIALRRAALA